MAARLVECVGRRDLVAGYNHGATSGEQPVGETVERRIARAACGVDARGLSDFQRILLVQDVARQRDEHRSGRRGHRDLRRAVHDARQVLKPGDLHRPLHERLRDRHERVVEQRLGKPVPLLLLSGGDDDRRADPLRVVDRAHRVPEPRSHVDVARAQVPGRARIAVGHRDDKRLLQRHDVRDRRPVGQGRHDRQLRWCRGFRRDGSLPRSPGARERLHGRRWNSHRTFIQSRSERPFPCGQRLDVLSARDLHN